MEEVRGFKDREGKGAFRTQSEEKREILAGEYVGVVVKESLEAYGYYRGVEGGRVVLTSTPDPESRRMEYDTRGRPFLIIEQDKPEERFEALFKNKPKIGYEKDKN